ncbi:hypothetical protein MHM88_14655 [Epibacterium sp. MM17-32]|uniref:hypothetical protein n=1 Tax=Epibacterium sp. MM17-32 TaxID=2917734 RepID=UPI001EF52533|nr:hypothetical protein [Epibacterium sp. MM17-32]MCG7629049.1 hypothetical protein [Epibacterium sp. MM17-32]
MKLETLAKRLAEKTNTPILEQVVLGEAPITELPTECMTWTGAKLGAAPRKGPRVSREARDGLTIAQVQDQPYGIIRWQKKTISVRRLLFQLINKPDYEFRMRCDCNVPLCVNPLHYTVEDITPEDVDQDGHTLEDITFDGDEGWELGEVEELVEILLTENEPSSWEEVVDHPLMEDVPPELLREVLVKLNKEHLT